MENLTSINRWKFFNLDRVEEILETKNKAIILICGASSSGKSYSADILKETLISNGLRPVILSTDSYNKGVSGIICDKVNLNFFNGKLENMQAIKQIVKNCIYETDFSQKFCSEDLKNISQKLNKFMNKSDLIKFTQALKFEFDKINFDEPSVYDLKNVAKDVKSLLNEETIVEKKYSKVISEQIENDNKICGSNIDVIIIEGIYALDDDLVNNIPTEQTVKNFVESNAKTLFLRRVIRDALTTSADNCFTINSYFKFIVPSYINQILPNKNKADFVFKNDMTFSELRSGNLYISKHRLQATNREFVGKLIKNSKIVSQEKQRDLYFCSEDEQSNEQNLLRLRTIYDSKTKTYIPKSLVHKGAIKNRKDKKTIRPINVLIKEGDFFKIFENEQDFVKNMNFAQFKIDRETIKTRTRIKFNEQEIVVDYVEGEGLFIEFSNEVDKKLINYITKNLKFKQQVQKQTKIDTKQNYDKKFLSK